MSVNGSKAGLSSADRFSRGSNQSGMRAYNERLVLSLLRRHGALAKTDIARLTELSAQTVSVIMRALEADGLIERGEPLRGKVGQPSVPMSLAAQGALFFGLKVGRRSADMVLIDFLGNTLGFVHHTYCYPAPQETVEFAEQAMSELSAKLTQSQQLRIAGLGIAMPFQLWNWAPVLGVPAGGMDAWRTRNIRAEIAANCPFPVYLSNDASAACGAELVFGRASRPSDFLYFYVGFFVGGGVVLNGQLYAGRSGNAGAVGSMPVPDAHGVIRQLIDIASIVTLEQALTASGHPTTGLWESPDEWQVEPETLTQWVEEAGCALAHAIVSAAAVLDCDEAIVDGWLPLAVRKALVEATQRQIANLNLAGIEPPQVRGGAIGYNARALGGASLPLSERFLVGQSAFPQGPYPI